MCCLLRLYIAASYVFLWFASSSSIDETSYHRDKVYYGVLKKATWPGEGCRSIGQEGTFFESLFVLAEKKVGKEP